MTPNIRFNLEIEPTTFMWNGIPHTLSGRCELLPDNQVQYLHRRVVCVARDTRGKIPFHGRVVGRGYRPNGRHTEYFYLVENEVTRKIEKTNRVSLSEEVEA